ncbi:MAG: porphobilinogen synthase [Proteobacteria bacterium]|nr:porphobilinogen synthase [Pseudomonadota bacterium]
MPFFYGRFPTTRLRRTRRYSWLQEIISETRLSVKDLVWPVFIREASDPKDIKTLPGLQRYTLNELPSVAQKALDLGMAAIALFPYIPFEKRTMDGDLALQDDNLVCQALRLLKSQFPSLGLIADVALDPYTTHGHDGIIRNNHVDNDGSVRILCQQALVQAQAGVDIVAPSDMMDGRIKAIRQTLDKAGFEHVVILSYAAKYASCFYGPFREAVGAPLLPKTLQDKRSYQQNPSNSYEALQEVALDLEEGADLIMVKPGLSYLDVVQRVVETFRIPTFIYQVSGEYSMIKAAALNGWIDEKKAFLETMIAMKRAGAAGIFTYAAPQIAQYLKEEEV